MSFRGFGGFFLFFFLATLNLQAESACERVFSLLTEESSLNIEKKILEVNSEGEFELHEWRLKNLPESSVERSGVLTFLIETNGSKRIEIESLFGSKSFPGVGRALKQNLRKTFPHHSIVSSLSMKNAERLLAALKDRPLNPDFSNVPAIASLEEDFELEFNFQRDTSGKMHLLEVSLIMKKNNVFHSRWLNKREVLNDPRYREWISSGFKASAFDLEKVIEDFVQGN